METERRRQVVLAILAVVLAVVVYRVWPTTSPLPARSSNQKASGTSGSAAGTGARGSAPAVAATDVHLEALEAERPKPGPHERNLFRFREKRLPPAPPRAGGEVAPSPAPPGPPPEPPGPPGPPPINLKFLGTVKGQAEGRPKIAILSDGNGPPFYGKEGDVVAGRYRILKIGEESIELAYADGRGRQTIRQTGS
jgi:hypothetical protein